jgi:hypothetical protein
MDRYTRWREALQQAPDVEAVNAIMRDYVDELGPVTGVFPGHCQAVIRGELDIQAAAVVLLQCELAFSGSKEARALLHEVAYTFASAAVRITLLHGRPSRARASDPVRSA